MLVEFTNLRSLLLYVITQAPLPLIPFLFIFRNHPTLSIQAEYPCNAYSDVKHFSNIKSLYTSLV